MFENYELKIKEYVNQLFENIPETPTKESYKKELTSDLLNKYNTLLSNNVDEKSAYNQVISNTKQPNYSFEKQPIDQPQESYNKKKSALITAIAVMLYILCPVSVIVLGSNGDGVQGVVIMFILVAIATGLLIYNSMTKPKYMKYNDFLDEDFENWEGISYQTRKTIKSIESALWAIIVLLYLAISFLTGAWHITWIIFLIGAALEKVIRAYFQYKEIK